MSRDAKIVQSLLKSMGVEQVYLKLAHLSHR